MRHLQRLDKPQILIKNEEEWTKKFLQSGNDRPNNKQYGHKEIKDYLSNISFKKCFYSEVVFTDLSEAQVDHYIEVKEDKSQAFEWTNLFLSCKDCNQGKISNSAIPNSATLDPFVHSDEEIGNHIYFEDEIILGRTEIGGKTIQKYNLQKDRFNLLRSKELTKFYKLLCLVKEGKLSIENILTFANIDRPFSMMFRLLLQKHNLL